MIISIRHYSHCKGLSLIELMVAMVIGLLLMTGTASMFISNKRIYTEQDEMGRLQENARFAVQMLIDDIRMAGYTGCVDDITQVNNGLVGMSVDDQLLSFVNGIEGIENSDGIVATTTPWQPSGGNDQIVNMVVNTDAITVRYLRPIGATITAAMGGAGSNVSVVADPANLQIGFIVGIADCDSTDIVQLTAAGTSLGHIAGAQVPGNVVANLSKAYDQSGEVTRFVARRYFIGTGAGGGPALFRVENQAAAVELIEGVENMQILYGEDTANNDAIADSYVTANAVTNWTNVVSVRIALLFRTVDENFSNAVNTRTYNMLGNPYTVVDDYNPPDPPGSADDRRRRREVINTIQIRNKRI